MGLMAPPPFTAIARSAAPARRGEAGPARAAVGGALLLLLRRRLLLLLPLPAAADVASSSACCRCMGRSAGVTGGGARRGAGELGLAAHAREVLELELDRARLPGGRATRAPGVTPRARGLRSVGRVEASVGRIEAWGRGRAGGSSSSSRQQQAAGSKGWGRASASVVGSPNLYGWPFTGLRICFFSGLRQRAVGL
jgi:hypothetical protein